MGTFSKAVVKDGKFFKTVYNLYGQFRYGRERRHTNYEAVSRGLESIHRDLRDQKKVEINGFGFLESQNITIGIPYKMGCNLGGGDWRVVRAIIEAEFENSPFDVLIVKKD